MSGGLLKFCYVLITTAIGGIVGGLLGLVFALGLGWYSAWSNPDDPSAGSIAIMAIFTVPLGAMGGGWQGFKIGVRHTGNWETPQDEQSQLTQDRAVSLLGLTIGAFVGAGFLGVLIAPRMMQPQNFPLEGAAREYLMGLTWILLLVGGGVIGGLVGRDLRL